MRTNLSPIPQQSNPAGEQPQDESYDTSDNEAVNKAKKRAGRTKADRLKFIKAAMQHPEGRSWFYDLLVYTNVIQTPYTQGDSHHTAFRCGAQTVGLRVLGDIQDAAPEFYLQMITENKKVKE